MNAAIAQHLNIAETAILRIEEWANVLFVVCQKLGARFVSKKVVEKKMTTKLDKANEIVAVIIEKLIQQRPILKQFDLESILIHDLKKCDLDRLYRLPNPSSIDVGDLVCERSNIDLIGLYYSHSMGSECKILWIDGNKSIVSINNLVKNAQS